MSRPLTLTLTLLILCLGGCAYSISPLATGETVVDDPDLSGTWEVISVPRTRDADLPAGKDGKEVTLEPIPNAPGSYWLERGEEDVLLVDLVKLDDVLYLEVSLEDSYNQLFSLPLFHVFRVSVRGDELHIASCDMRSLAEAVAKTKQQHICRELDIILIGTTEEVQQFYREHGDAIFGKSHVSIFKKKQTADHSGQGSHPGAEKDSPAKGQQDSERPTEASGKTTGTS